MNQELLNNLRILQDYYKKVGDNWRVLAYTKAITAISIYPEEITSRAQAMKIKGVGKGIADKIQEFLKFGKIEKVEDAKKEMGEIDKKRTTKEQIIYSFKKIWGVGPVKAEELFGKGMRSISDIRKKGEKFLTANQIVGLKYYDDLLEPIPREYITIFHGVFNYV